MKQQQLKHKKEAAAVDEENIKYTRFPHVGPIYVLLSSTVVRRHYAQVRLVPFFIISFPVFVTPEHSACMWALALTFQHAFVVGYHQPFVEGHASIAEEERLLLCSYGLLAEEKAGPAAGSGKVWHHGRPSHPTGS